MTTFGELLDSALELWNMYPPTRQGSDHLTPSGTPQRTELEASDRELAAAIAQRRGVSVDAAEDMVRWLRTERPDFGRGTGAP